jgi:hypothetical protein
MASLAHLVVRADTTEAAGPATNTADAGQSVIDGIIQSRDSISYKGILMQLGLMSALSVSCFRCSWICA